MADYIYQIALPVPMRRCFDYRSTTPLAAGQRVRVNMAGRELIGVVMGEAGELNYDAAKIKPIQSLVDDSPLLTAQHLALCHWVARYYHHAIGEVIARSVPVLARKGEPLQLETETVWQCTDMGRSIDIPAIARAKKQQQAMQLLQGNNEPLLASYLKEQGVATATLKALSDKGWVERLEVEQRAHSRYQSAQLPALTEEQYTVVEGVTESRVGVHLIDGVTGSGKTEIYIRLIQRVIEQGKQALVLVPEIGLTPQLLDRIARRIDAPVVTYHSHNSDKQQWQSWQFANNGQARVVVGTRSAAFAQLPDLGLIIVDEEHDASFKSQDAVRFNGRDLAVKRAADLNIPIVLGSATPSLESLNGVEQGRYRYWRLSERATKAAPPQLKLIDLKLEQVDSGVAETSRREAIAALKRGEQVMVFLNRRGYSPEMRCGSCGWQAECTFCDVKATVHLARSQLGCHHCGSFWPLPNRCPQCNSVNLQFVGSGTERLEYELETLFEGYPVLRIDRDSISTQSKLEKNLEQIHAGEPCVIVGTQMLAKGHHFANLSTVIVLGTDSALMAADFRAPERLGQLITQVAGRAGRECGNGRVYLQTEMPAHPWMQCLARLDYREYAAQMQTDRQTAMLPPYRQMAILRAEHHQPSLVEDLMAQTVNHFQDYMQSQGVQAVGPMLAPMARVANRTRYQLWLIADQRTQLHRVLAPMVEYLEQHKLARAIRWSVDVDPQDMS